MMCKIIGKLNVSCSLVFAVGALFSSFVVAEDAGFSSYVDKKGNISFPQGFRISMAHLGSWFGLPFASKK
jgi:hypothetical protein